jgi:putative phosphoesterase
MSDSHDRVPAIAELVRRLSAAGVGMVLHAGDYCSPFSLAPFIKEHVTLAGVFGRNDGDREGLRAYAGRGMGTELYESPHSLELGGRRILLVHDIGEVHDRSVEGHAIVVTGHTHQRKVSTRGDALIVNPGESCGWLHGVPSAAVLDLDTREVEFLTLDGAEWKT